MPEISRFLGIVIAMYWRDAPPHFHAYHGDYDITVEIETGHVAGEFPKRALDHVLEWTQLHRRELLENWTLAQQRGTLKKISPLE